MSKEERDWLEGAMKQNSFDDTGRMKDVIEVLKSNRTEIEEGKDGRSPEKLVEYLEELQDLAELHPRNNLNLCLYGGFPELMVLIMGHPELKVRVAACMVVTCISANNHEV